MFPNIFPKIKKNKKTFKSLSDEAYKKYVESLNLVINKSALSRITSWVMFKVSPEFWRRNDFIVIGTFHCTHVVKSIPWTVRGCWPRNGHLGVYIYIYIYIYIYTPACLVMVQGLHWVTACFIFDFQLDTSQNTTASKLYYYYYYCCCSYSTHYNGDLYKVKQIITTPSSWFTHKCIHFHRSLQFLISSYH